MNGHRLISPIGVGELHFGRSGIDMSSRIPLNDDQLREWVKLSLSRQGLSIEIDDAEVLRKINVLAGMES